MDENIKFEIAKLDLRPNDILVVKLGDVISMDEATHLRDEMSAWLPSSNKIIILSDGADISIIRPEDIA